MANRVCLTPVGSNMLKTNEQFLEEVSVLYGDEYTILEPYIKAHAKIKMRHNACGIEFYKTPHALLAGHGCGKCASKRNGEKLKRTTQQFKDEAFALVGNEYSVLEEYVKNTTPLLMRHEKCGHEWKVRPIAFIRGCRCPKCSPIIVGKKRTLTHEEFVRRVEQLEGSEYTVTGKYQNSDTKIEIKHNLCGQYYTVTPSMFVSGGNRCPFCANSSQSNGARLIQKYCQKNNLGFKREVKFPDCKNKVSLPFDFAIYNESLLLMLIEFDGVQHFRPVKLFGGQVAFNRLQKNDAIKTTYCSRKGINLLRISYKEVKNIEQILDQEIQKLKIPIQLCLLG